MLGLALTVVAGVGVLVVGGAQALSRLGVVGAPSQEAADPLACGELSRVRSVGAIGLTAPAEVVNLLTYPQRGQVELRGPDGEREAEATALVDECPTGWRSAEDAGRPVTLVIRPARDGVWLQRIVLWQDPQAPRSSWVRDFQVLVSPTGDADDLQPVLLDRPTQLAPSVEQQWFGIIRAAPPGAVPPHLLPPQEREQYAQANPEVVFVRRIAIRITSTYGDLEARGQQGPVSLGEVAAFGPDLELRIADVTEGGSRTNYYRTSCQVRASACEIHALAGRPVSVLVINESWDAHVFATAGQDKNARVTVEPNQAASVQFVAASRPGRYEFSCPLPGHQLRGDSGFILVR